MVSAPAPTEHLQQWRVSHFYVEYCTTHVGQDLLQGLHPSTSRASTTMEWVRILYEISTPTPPKHLQQNRRARCLSTTSSMEVQGVSPPSAVWTCRVAFHHKRYGRAECTPLNLRTVFVNSRPSRLSGIRSFRYRTEHAGCRNADAQLCICRMLN